MQTFNKIYQQIVEMQGPRIEFNRSHKDAIRYTTPEQQNIDYLGFTKTMTPENFRHITLGSRDQDEIGNFKDRFARDGYIVLAPPFIKAEWLDNEGMWSVLEQGGSARVDFAFMHGISLIPVDILPQYMKAVDITEEMKSAPFIPQR